MNNRKRKAVIWLISVVFVSLIGGVVAKVRANSPTRYPHVALWQHKCIGQLIYVLDTKLPQLPSKVRVYKVKPLASRKDTLLKIFKSLPLTSSPETAKDLCRLELAPELLLAPGEDSLSAYIGGWEVEVWNGGQFCIRKVDELPNQPGKYPPAPAPNIARKAADDFLSKIGSLPCSVRFSQVGTGESGELGGGNTPISTIITKLGVSYSAEMNGIPIDGGVDIRVADGPAVVGMLSRLRHVKPDKKLPIISPKEAFDQLSAGNKTVDASSPWNAVGKVKSIKLVYWESILAEDLSYIMPVYVFEGDTEAKGKKPEHWTAYVEAVRPEFLEPSMNTAIPVRK